MVEGSPGRGQRQAYEELLQSLPKPVLTTRARLKVKTTVPKPTMGPRPGAKPADWPRFCVLGFCLCLCAVVCVCVSGFCLCLCVVLVLVCVGVFVCVLMIVVVYVFDCGCFVCVSVSWFGCSCSGLRVLPANARTMSQLKQNVDANPNLS